MRKLEASVKYYDSEYYSRYQNFTQEAENKPEGLSICLNTLYPEKKNRKKNQPTAVVSGAIQVDIC